MLLLIMVAGSDQWHILEFVWKTQYLWVIRYIGIFLSSSEDMLIDFRERKEEVGREREKH